MPTGDNKFQHIGSETSGCCQEKVHLNWRLGICTWEDVLRPISKALMNNGQSEFRPKYNLQLWFLERNFPLNLNWKSVKSFKRKIVKIINTTTRLVYENPCLCLIAMGHSNSFGEKFGFYDRNIALKLKSEWVIRHSIQVLRSLARGKEQYTSQECPLKWDHYTRSK